MKLIFEYLTLDSFKLFGFIYITWLAFSGMMNFYRMKLQGLIKPLSFVWFLTYPAVGVFLVADFTINVFLTIPMAELPKEWLTTQRLHRYMLQKVGWRCLFATWVCHTLLDPLSPTGHHCE